LEDGGKAFGTYAWEKAFTEPEKCGDAEDRNVHRQGNFLPWHMINLFTGQHMDQQNRHEDIVAEFFQGRP
jgi:hypothetical protein